MQEVRTEEAVGKVLLHDITKIVKGEFKGVAYKKGHVIQKDDVEKLKDLGKFSLFVGDIPENSIHENDAALALKHACMGKNLKASEIKEGKIELIATLDGLLDINIDALDRINDIDDIIIATRLSGFEVKNADRVAGMRIVPLYINKDKLEKVEKITDGKPIINVIPFKKIKYALLTIGNEVYNKRIEDTFSPVIESKLKKYDAEMIMHETVSDDLEMIENALMEMCKEKSVDAVFCTGGMSVDPDDRTPKAIKDVTKEIICYGVPSLPGSMFMLAIAEDNKPVVGLPGCVMFAKNTIFDWVLPKIIAGIKLRKKDFKRLGYGGFCTSCDVCHFPNCWHLNR